MMRPHTFLLSLSAAAGAVASASSRRANGDSDSSTTTTIWATPHASYSSSIGVLGCKVDTNRIAYWPMSPDCDSLCVEVSYGGRSLELLRIDQSGGAYDMSYDAWNYLLTGQSATEDPTAGGATEMTYKNVDASRCKKLIKTSGSKLPLSASNSMNFLGSCIAQPDSWVAQNFELFNIQDATCLWGFDEKCSLDVDAWPVNPVCPHTLGLQQELNEPVYNIEYPSGETVLASDPTTVVDPNEAEGGSSRLPSSTWGLTGLMAGVVVGGQVLFG